MCGPVVIKNGILLLLLFHAGTLAAQRAEEYQVKAAYLYNFSKFLEWPETAFNNHSDPFIVAILGRDPFGNHLAEIVSGETAFGRPIQIKHYASLSQLGACHILYINLPGQSDEALSALKGQSVLTVSDDPDFCRYGGIVRFFQENETIRLEISPTSAKNANLNVSSKLLRVAKICE